MKIVGTETGRFTHRSVHFSINPKLYEEEMQSLIIEGLEQAGKRLEEELEKLIKGIDIERSWNFTVSHPDMICPKEVSEMLSRKNPIAFIKATNDTSNVLHVVFHMSIVKKARYLSNFPFNVDYLGNEIYMAHNVDKTRSEIVTWAKKIRNESWGKFGNTTKVTVGIPKI